MSVFLVLGLVIWRFEQLNLCLTTTTVYDMIWPFGLGNKSVFVLYLVTFHGATEKSWRPVVEDRSSTREGTLFVLTLCH